MKVWNFFFISFFFVCGLLKAQPTCCMGYDEGYRRGYSYPNMDMSGIVYVPSCGCYRIIGNPSYNDGFALGFADGQRQKAEENSRQEQSQGNAPQQHQRFVYPDYVPGSVPPAEWQQARIEANWEAFTGAVAYCAKFFSEFQLSFTKFTNLENYHPAPFPALFVNPTSVDEFNSITFVAKHNMKKHFRLEAGYFNALSFGKKDDLYKNQFAKFKIATLGLNYNFRKYRSYKFFSPYIGAEIFRCGVKEAGISTVLGSEFRVGYHFSIDLRHRWSKSVFLDNTGGKYTYIPNLSLGLIYKVK